MRAIVMGADQPLGSAAAQGLRSLGWTVDETNAGNSPFDLLVVCGWSAAGLTPIAFEDVSDEVFAACWEGGMQGMLWAIQSAIPHLRHGSNGSVVVLMPTTGMTGGARYAPAAATFEGQRILMKAAARQLGPQGIRVNAIAVAPELVLADADAADVHYLAPGAIPGRPAAADLVDVISFLTSPAARHFSGQTLTIDGGNWLAP